MTTKTKNIIAWILAGLLAFAFAGSGIAKIMGTEMQIKNVESWGYPLWTRFPIGLSELLLAIALLFPKYRKLTVFAIFGWTLVAVITHLQSGQANLVLVPVFFSVFGVAILLLQKGNSTHA